MDYEYRGLMAEAWDLLRGDTSGWADRAYYLEAIRRHGEPVLDVGCGTGRLLLDFMALGIDMDGIDNSPDMLAICRSKAAEARLVPTLYEQEMRDVDLPRKFRTILIPSSSLQLVIDPGERTQALRRLRDHLLPGGVVTASIMAVWKRGTPLESQWERSAVRPSDGATIRRISRSRYDPETECEDTEDVYQVVKDGVVLAEEHHQRAPATRNYTQAQARAAFEQAGFRRIELTSGFTDALAQADDQIFMVTASAE